MGYVEYMHKEDINIIYASKKPERSLWLDVLRGLAIFGVVSTHSIQLTDNLLGTNNSNFFSWFAGLGKYGVELFFFLSGWLLASIYGISGKKLGKSYLVRRIGRIYPLWVFFMLVGLLRWEFTNSGRLYSPINTPDGNNFLHSTAGVILLTLSFTLFVSASLSDVIPGGWSINAEVAHYILFPLIRNRSLNQILRIVILINFITSLIFLLRPRVSGLPILCLQIIDAWLRLSLYSTLGYFLIGILTYLSFKQIKISKATNLKFSDFDISPKILIIFCVSLLVIPCPFGNQVEAIGYIGIMILISSGILKYQKPRCFFKLLGKYSYFIYFMHFIILMVIRWITERIHLIPSGPGSQQLVFVAIFIFSLGVSLLLAIPSMKYFEKPIIEMSHKN
jgi:peptidoglycan/LPS O-acetylase OafA/YrhL